MQQEVVEDHGSADANGCRHYRRRRHVPRVDAVPEPFPARDVRVDAERTADGWRLIAEKGFVTSAGEADAH